MIVTPDTKSGRGYFMLGKRLRQARLEAGLSQTDLAEDLFSRSYISEIERGRISPSSENLQLLAERLRRPISYFLPSILEADDFAKKAIIDRIQSLAIVGQSSEAMELALSLEPSMDSLSSANKANFLRITAWMQYNAGHLLTAITRSFQASEIYAQLADCQSQWYTLHSAAHCLYIRGSNHHALEIVQKALMVSLTDPAYVKGRELSHYLSGCILFAMGDTARAGEAFQEAGSSVSTHNWDTAIRAFLGRGSCEMEQGNLTEAFRWAQQAREIADDRHYADLSHRGRVLACECLVMLGQHQEADILLRNTCITADPDTRRYALRTYLSAMAETKTIAHTTVSWAIAELERLRNSTDPLLDVEDQWAIGKIGLLAKGSVQEIAQTIDHFGNEFARLGCGGRSAKVFRFGAELLRSLGAVEIAYDMLAKSCQLREKGSGQPIN